MPELGRHDRDLRGFALPRVGELRETGDRWEPYRLLDPAGEIVGPVALFFNELMAADSSPLTPRSYGMDLLRWFRFLWAFGTEWDRAVREDARDFMLWMKLADKPKRVHWRHHGSDAAEVVVESTGRPEPGTPNAVTGKSGPGAKYAASTRAHCETVLRAFYDFHLERGSGALLVNPFPLVRDRRWAASNSHRVLSAGRRRMGRYRPRVPKRVPRRIPDEKFADVFAALRSDRDRALLSFWVVSGARAEELLGARQKDASVGAQTIGVVRKGNRAYQELPAGPDAFVWLRLYQEAAWRVGVPRGPGLPLWWTLRRPWRPLAYDAARAMFRRANEVLGANWTLHDLRHTAAVSMLGDPSMPPVFVQKILGHRNLSTLDVYSRPSRDDVVAAGLRHAERLRDQKTSAVPAPGYDPVSLETLFAGPPR